MTPVRPHRPVLRIVFGAALAIAFVGFCALGIWQLQRLEWKRDLVARVDARVHAEPSTPPPRSEWTGIDAATAEYRRVRLSGTYLDVPQARTQAVTALGAGWWLLAPMQLDDGAIVLVNRGFLPAGEAIPSLPAQPVAVVGLLRLSEPGGGFLRDNAPGEDRWHSRDVAAIAASRGLDVARVAPYFIDAERDPAANAWPRGGMTVVRFRDHHLQYALTWFGLALLCALAFAWLFVSERLLRHHRQSTPQDHDHAGPSSRR